MLHLIENKIDRFVLPYYVQMMALAIMQQNDVDGIVCYLLLWLKFFIFNVKGPCYFYLLFRCPPIFREYWMLFVFQKSNFIVTTVVCSSYSILNGNLSPFSLYWLFFSWRFRGSRVFFPPWLLFRYSFLCVSSRLFCPASWYTRCFLSPSRLTPRPMFSHFVYFST